MTNILRAIAMFLLLAAVSCKPDESLRPSYIIIADPGVHPTEVNHEVSGGYNHADTLVIDLDGDGTADIRFGAAIVGSPGSGVRGYSFLNCLHSDIQVAAESHPYDVYEDVRQDSARIDPDKPYYQQFTVYERTCDPTSGFPLKESGFIDDITFQAGDTLRKGDGFSAKSSFNLNTTTGTTITQTPAYGFPAYRYITHNEQCGYPDFTDTTYAGFRLHDRLGWVKFRRSGMAQIQVYDYAIQQP